MDYTYIVLIVVVVVWSILGTAVVVKVLEEDAIGQAFGWPSYTPHWQLPLIFVLAPLLLLGAVALEAWERFQDARS